MKTYLPKELGLTSFFEDEIYTLIDIYPIKQCMYLISNYGNIYSLFSRKIIKYTISEKGYARVTLQIESIDPLKYQKNYKVHRLVAFYFCENSNPDILIEVDHLDTNRLNNYYKNLEWVDHKENIKRAKERGNMIDNSTEEFIRSICKMFEDGISIFDVYSNFHPEELGKTKNLDDRKFYKFLYLILMNKRHSFIRSQYNIDIEKVKSPYFQKNIYNVEQITKLIKDGKNNIEIMNEFGYKGKDDNSSLYKRIITIRKKVQRLSKA